MKAALMYAERNLKISFMFFISGAFVPLTMQGNIVVDGVLASCYGSYNHDIAHIAMTPMRWFPDLLELIFGREIGSPKFVNIAQNFGEWLLPWDLTHFGRSRKI